jgi:hypothetical protein
VTDDSIERLKTFEIWQRFQTAIIFTDVLFAVWCWLSG